VGSPPPSHAASGEDPISADPASRCLVGAARQRVQLIRGLSISSHAVSSDDPISADLASRCLVGAARQRVQLIRGLSTSLSRHILRKLVVKPSGPFKSDK
jgi:hypothetical protein